MTTPTPRDQSDRCGRGGTGRIQPPDSSEGEPAPASRGRGPPAESQARGARAAKVKGRTIYLHDDLFERIIVQAHRRGRTISEYVAAVLERQVPDHRVVRAEQAEPGKTDAA